jgi:hypothetical protein
MRLIASERGKHAHCCRLDGVISLSSPWRLFSPHPGSRGTAVADSVYQVIWNGDGSHSNASLPAQSRAAFAKKASWFRMLAQIGRAKEIGARSSASCEQKLPRKPSNIRGQTLTERLSRARPIGFLTAKQATDGARHDRRQAEADW